MSELKKAQTRTATEAEKQLAKAEYLREKAEERLGVEQQLRENIETTAKELEQMLSKERSLKERAQADAKDAGQQVS